MLRPTTYVATAAHGASMLDSCGDAATVSGGIATSRCYKPAGVATIVATPAAMLAGAARAARRRGRPPGDAATVVAGHWSCRE